MCQPVLHLPVNISTDKNNEGRLIGEQVTVRC